ncbi:hypothetical protein ACET3Z_025331 [Daucus carota]
MVRTFQNKAWKHGHDKGFIPVDEARIRVLKGFMLLLIPLVVMMMVVSVIRREEGRGRAARIGDRGSHSGGGFHWGRCSSSTVPCSSGSGRGRGRGRGSGGGTNNDGFNELSSYFERADKSISNGDYLNAQLHGEPKKDVVTFSGK